jgi:hypothetical protein
MSGAERLNASASETAASNQTRTSKAARNRLRVSTNLQRSRARLILRAPVNVSPDSRFVPLPFSGTIFRRRETILRRVKIAPARRGNFPARQWTVVPAPRNGPPTRRNQPSARLDLPMARRATSRLR